MTNYTAAHLDMLARLLAGQVLNAEELRQLRNCKFLSNNDKLTPNARRVIANKCKSGDIRFMD